MHVKSREGGQWSYWIASIYYIGEARERERERVAAGEWIYYHIGEDGCCCGCVLLCGGYTTM